MTEDYPNIKDTADGVPPDETLLVEYQEVGTEWRNYETLLNQSYYLAAVVFTFFVGAITNLFSQNSYMLAASLGLFAFAVFLVLGFAGRAYHQRRNAASRLRTKIAEELHELTNSRVPRIQKVVVGGGSVRIDSQKSGSDDFFRGLFPLYRLAFLTSIGWLLMTGFLWILFI